MLRPLVLLPHRSRRLVIVAFYAALIPAAYASAFGLRFDFRLGAAEWRVLLATLPLVAALRLGCYAARRLFQGYWRHFGLYDLRNVVVGTTWSSVLFVLALPALGLNALDGSFPRGVIAIDWALAIFAVAGTHAAARCVREGEFPWRPRGDERRVLLLGAGEAAERLLRHLRQDRRLAVRVVGLLDDDERKHHRRIHGVPVLGRVADVGRLAAAYDARLLVVAMPSAPPDAMRVVVEHCLATGLEFRALRPLRETVDGRAPGDVTRQVEVEDLLGRPPVRLELDGLVDLIAGRCVLVTGGAGSIGAELARQVARLGPSELVIVEQAETPLFFTHLELTREFPDLAVTPVVASVCDRADMRRVFAAHGPTCVFHAAAYKHVPMMEANVLAAVRTNVFGTLVVAECAAEFGADKFVLLSTDKAVNPSSVMGATKRVAERVVLGYAPLRRSGTEFRAVRFGNVLGSNGSVIPLFRRQLQHGGPLTVTHPDVRRYFMTVQEAVQLVLHSATLREAAGRVAMLEMGEPVRIVELAENLVRLSGREPYTDVPIVFTGLRAGEKMSEDLMTVIDETVATGVDKIRVFTAAEPRGGITESVLDELAAAVAARDPGAAVGLIQALVPECVAPLRGLRLAPAPRAPDAPSAAPSYREYGEHGAEPDPADRRHGRMPAVYDRRTTDRIRISERPAHNQ